MLRSMVMMAMLVVGTTGALRQEGATWRKADIYLDSNRPSVFIDFVRVEKSSGKGWVWLRLYNNTRWEIRYKADPIHLKERGVDAENVRYENSSKDGRSTSGGDMVRVEDLQPGEFIYFRVPLSKIDYRGWMISVDFEFGWEDTHNEPQHRVHFSYFDLPQGLRESLCSNWTGICP